MSEETLRREMREEACATVVKARLLGFCRSACVVGPQAGQVLVRSVWRAEVELAPWEPQFEVTHRRLVAPAEVIDHLAAADASAHHCFPLCWLVTSSARAEPPRPPHRDRLITACRGPVSKEGVS